MGFIRILLALAVVVAHSSPILGAGWTRLTGGLAAVQTFYVISGFYMALILNTKYVGEGSWALFIKSRFMRLFPAYAVVAIGAVLAGLILREGGRPGIPPVNQWLDNARLGLTSWFLGLTNLTLLGQDVTMFLAVDPATHHLFFTKSSLTQALPAYRFLLVPQAWTIGLELWFYLLAPFIVKSKSRTVRVFVVFFVLRLALRNLAGLRDDPWTYRFFPMELPLFLMGALAWRAYESLRGRGLLSRRSGAAAVGFIVIWIVFYQWQPRLPLAGRLYDWTGIPALSIAFACLLPWIFQFSKNLRLDRMAGELSYPLYMTHWLISHVLAQMGVAELGLRTCAVSLAASAALLVAVDLPIDRWRQSWVKPSARQT